MTARIYSRANQGESMKTVKRWAAAILACASMVALGQGHNPTPDESVPKDLRPLLAPHHSELRLIVTRYNADRVMLAGNYAGSNTAGGGGGGRGGRGGRGADAGPTL